MFTRLGKTIVSAALFTVALAVSPANATILDFSYQTSAFTLTGRIDGVIQGDGDTVLINSITNLMADGWLLPSFPYLTTPEAEASFPGYYPPVASFSGSLVDFMVCDSPACFDGLLIDTTGVAGPPSFASGPVFEDYFEPYFAANWSLTRAAVPEPATLALFGMGLLGLGLVRRRR